jgi:hypothetical protein
VSQRNILHWPSRIPQANGWPSNRTPLEHAPFLSRRYSCDRFVAAMSSSPVDRIRGGSAKSEEKSRSKVIQVQPSSIARAASHARGMRLPPIEKLYDRYGQRIDSLSGGETSLVKRDLTIKLEFEFKSDRLLAVRRSADARRARPEFPRRTALEGGPVPRRRRAWRQ